MFGKVYYRQTINFVKITKHNVYQKHFFSSFSKQIASQRINRDTKMNKVFKQLHLKSAPLHVFQHPFNVSSGKPDDN
jgi:hypothetical protein